MWNDNLSLGNGQMVKIKIERMKIAWMHSGITKQCHEMCFSQRVLSNTWNITCIGKNKN